MPIFRSTNLSSMSSLAEKGLHISKNAIFRLFVGQATKLLGRPFRVATVLNEVATKLADEKSKDSKFQQLFDVALTLVRLVRRYASGEYRQVPTGTLITGLAVLLYVLSPIDIIPDFIPVVGFLDDLALISWFVGKFQGEIIKFRDWENAQTGAPRPDTAAEPARGDKALPSVAELGHS